MKVIELFKFGRKSLKNKLHRLICHIWEEEVMSEDWNMGINVPVLERGDKTECRNYRSITLLNVVYKILSSV